MNPPNQQPSAAAVKAKCADIIEVAGTLTALASAAGQSEKIEGSHHLVIAPGYTHKDITDLVERAQPAPNRKRGTHVLKSLDSLLAYLADQQGKGSAYIYADPDSCTITAVFDDHRGTTPGWREHRAVFKAEQTSEFRTWITNNKQAKDQTAFAEFIEDNLSDITAPGAQTLLDVATTIQATTGINFSSAKRLQSGQTQLTYTENIDARAGANGALEIPKEFQLGVRLFKNGEGYKLRARLKYRLSQGSVKFWYELDRPEIAVEDAFGGYVSRLRDISGYQVLIGCP